MARITLADRLTALVNDENLDQRSRDFAGDLLKHLLAKKSLTRGRRVWVDRLEARAAEAAAAPKVEVPADVKALHEKIVEREGEKSWSAGFVGSIIHQMSQGRALSRRQQEVLAEKREEFSGEWETEYRTAYRADAVLLASYYRASRLPYWQGMTTKILEVEDYVPSKRSFFKMYTNKFAQRVLEQNKAPATFAVRDAVQLRNNAHTRANFPGLAGKRGFILSVGGVVEAVKGGRGYTVLFAGSSKPLVVTERCLKGVK